MHTQSDGRTRIGMPAVPRRPYRPQPMKLRDWPRRKLLHYVAICASRAREIRADRVAFVCDVASDALVALEVADLQVAELRRELAAERARSAMLIAQIGPEGFNVQTRGPARNPLLDHERPTAAIDVPEVHR